MGYKVKVRWLSGKGNKMWESGDTVTESDFPENFHKLLKEGRIIDVSEGKTIKEPVEEIDKKEVVEVDEVIEETAENQETTEDSEDEEVDFTNPMGTPLFVIDGKDVYTSEDITKKEIVKLLTEKEIEFSKTSRKDVLWDLLIK